MTRPDIHAFAALDFEASSLSAASWPIEVGLSWIAQGEVWTWSSLIRPSPDWTLSDWSQKSAAVHGIALDDLQAAPPAAAVAEELLEVLAGRTPVSDAPDFDGHWLARLLATRPDLPAPVLENYIAVSHAAFTGRALDLLHETLARRRTPHRAGPDSARLAAGWARALAALRSASP